MATDQKFRYNFYRLIDVNHIPESLSTTILMCKESPPPSRKDNSVVTYSEMNWTTKIQWDKLPQRQNQNGKMFYELEFQTVMQRSSGFTDISVLRNGRKQAAKNVEVEFFDKADV